MQKRLTAEYFKDKIVPLPPFEFVKGDRITAEKLAAYVGNTVLDDNSHLGCRTLGSKDNYRLERVSFCKVIGNKIEQSHVEYKLIDKSFYNKFWKTGVTSNRNYTFIQDGDDLVCKAYGHEMCYFYDEAYLDDDGNLQLSDS
jgi:hypothetical protein